MTIPTQGFRGIASGLAALAVLLAASASHAADETRMVAIDDQTWRHTCPSTDCGIVGRFYRGESVVVYERANGWARVSLSYTAGCSDGLSAFVEEGNAACESSNGIEDGEFFEWVSLDDLTEPAG